MQTVTIMAIAVVIAMAVASYLDWNSTSEALKRGTGTEANPVIAWLMAKLGKAFPAVFIGGKVLLTAGFVLMALGMPHASYYIAGLLAFTGLYLVYVVAHNYDISK